MTPLIACDNVSLSYDGKTVLSGLTFNVHKGDYLCVIGENGSGKSSLVRAILSLMPVSGGHISFGGGLKRTEVGYLPQQTGVQKDFPASVWEVVLSGCLNSRGLRPFYSKADRQKASENIEKLGVSKYKERSYKELSGGQQQRVLLARAMCATKKLLLLDEPAAGLDPVVTGELYEIIKKINSEGITVIMVSHDIPAAIKYSTHILHLRKKPVFFGRTIDYSVSPEGRKFLGGHQA